MSVMLSRSRWIALATVILAGLIACQRSSLDTSTEGKSKEAATPLTVEEIRVGVLGEGDQTIRPQIPQEPIHVAMKTSGSSQGANLEVKIFELSNGQIVANEMRRLKPSGPAVTDLIFKRETGWNPGRHLIEVTLDGKLVGQRDFDVIDLSAPNNAAR